MKLLLDMNLSPEWVEFFEEHDLEAVHWATVGNPRASDPEILAWARQGEWTLFTNDLDFGRLLALTYAKGPSVLQLRGGDLLPEGVGNVVLTALRESADSLATGALVVVDADRFRVRLLPIRSG